MGETARLVHVMSPRWQNLIVQSCTCSKNVVSASAGKKGKCILHAGMESACRDCQTILFICFMPNI